MRVLRCRIVTVARSKSISPTLMARSSEILQPKRNESLISSLSRRQLAACSISSMSVGSRQAFMGIVTLANGKARACYCDYALDFSRPYDMASDLVRKKCCPISTKGSQTIALPSSACSRKDELDTENSSDFPPCGEQICLFRI